MASARKLQKQEMKTEARNQRRVARDEWKRKRKQDSDRNAAIVTVGILMALEATLMGLLSEWIFLTICTLLAVSALMVRPPRGAAVVGAFVIAFALYFAYLHINTLLVLWPYKDATDGFYIRGIHYKWSHSVWLAFFIKNSVGAGLTFLSIVFGIASIVPALKANNNKDTRASSRTSPAGNDPAQNVVIETYPPQPGPVLLQTAPLGHATLLQPVGVAYVTNVPPPPGVPFHTLNVAERPVVYQQSPGSPQFYTANTQQPPHFQTQAPGYVSPQQMPYNNPTGYNAPAPGAYNHPTGGAQPGGY